MTNRRVPTAGRNRRRSPRTTFRPTLRFTPTAWAKLLYLRDRGPTEVGGFGIGHEDDPLLIEDLILVRQQCTRVTVSFDDEAVADFFDRMVDEGFSPARFGRIWIHTHPGGSATPSHTDESTFERVFGGCDWAVMFILAEGGRTYARLRFGVGPGGELRIPVEVDFASPFAGSNHESWVAEYDRCVVGAEPPRPTRVGDAEGILAEIGLDDWNELLELEETIDDRR